MANGPPQPQSDQSDLTDQPDSNFRQIKLCLAMNVSMARHRAGLTQLELAQAAELSRATVHMVEAGICDARLSTIARLSTALQMDALDLLKKDLPTRKNALK